MWHFQSHVKFTSVQWVKKIQHATKKLMLIQSVWNLNKKSNAGEVPVVKIMYRNKLLPIFSSRVRVKDMASTGIEPATFALLARRSNQLS